MRPVEIACKAFFERKAMQDLSSFTAFMEFLNSVPHKSILEIGSAYGGTLWAWCQMFESVTSITLDGGEWWPLHPYEADIILGDSRDPEVIAKATRRYDVVFIDGDHDITVEDFNNYGWMAPIVAIHDIYTFSKDGWLQLKAAYEYREFPGRCGIGVIFTNPPPSL